MSKINEITDGVAKKEFIEIIINALVEDFIKTKDSSIVGKIKL